MDHDSTWTRGSERSKDKAMHEKDNHFPFSEENIAPANILTLEIEFEWNVRG